MSRVLASFAGHVQAHPDRPALVFTRPGDAAVHETATYGELYAQVEAFARGLSGAGIGAGEAVILACPLSVDFVALAIALVGSRRRLVLIDGRLDRRRLLSALRSARAGAIVSVAGVLRRWPMVPPLWRMRRYVAEVDLGAADTGAAARPPRGVHALRELRCGSGAGAAGAAGARAGFDPGAGRPDDPAIISFTSGSTARAKGAIRTHAILDAQHAALSRHIPLVPGEADMTCFPAVVLHNLACGVTTVLPPVDLREPASVSPVPTIEAIREQGVTTLSGAPAFIGRLADHVLATGCGGLAALRRIAVGDAPVTPSMARQLHRAFPDAEIVVVYGSTEAEPISLLDGREVACDAGEGILVGVAVQEADVELVSLPERIDLPVKPGWLAERRAPSSEAGELVVRGDGVSRDYVGDPEAVARNKVRVRDGSVWHRTGDVARRDELGRLRLLGRVGDAVAVGDGGEVVYPLALEAALGEVDGVSRAALVSAASGPTVAVAVDPGADGGVVESVRAALEATGLGDVAVRAVEAIPVDARHQSKIDRAALIALLDG